MFGWWHLSLYCSPWGGNLCEFVFTFSFRDEREPLRYGDELPSFNLVKQFVTCTCENATLTFVSRIRRKCRMRKLFRYCLVIVVFVALSWRSRLCGVSLTGSIAPLSSTPVRVIHGRRLSINLQTSRTYKSVSFYIYVHVSNVLLVQMLS